MAKVNYSGVPKVTSRRTVETKCPENGEYCEYFEYEDITFVAYRIFTSNTGNVRKVIYRCHDCNAKGNSADCTKYYVKLRRAQHGHFLRCDKCITHENKSFEKKDQQVPTKSAPGAGCGCFATFSAMLIALAFILF